MDRGQARLHVRSGAQRRGRAQQDADIAAAHLLVQRLLQLRLALGVGDAGDLGLGDAGLDEAAAHVVLDVPAPGGGRGGVDEHELGAALALGAVAFVESVAEMLAGLTTADGDPIGWSVGGPSIFDDEPAPRYRFHSTAAAMFGAVFYRYGCIAATCKNCGNGILVKTRGKRREFCSPSCRTQHSNRKCGL